MTSPLKVPAGDGRIENARARRGILREINNASYNSPSPSPSYFLFRISALPPISMQMDICWNGGEIGKKFRNSSFSDGSKTLIVIWLGIGLETFRIQTKLAILLGGQDKWRSKLTSLNCHLKEKWSPRLGGVPPNLCADDRKRNERRTERGLWR